MRSRRRPDRSAGPIFLTAVLAALLAGACGEREVSDEEAARRDRPNFRESDIHAEYGLEGVSDSRVFNELRVRVTNSGGGHFNGRLRVHGVVPDPESGGETVRSPLGYSIPLEVPFGETRLVSLPVRLDDWVAVDIRLSQGRSRWDARVFPNPAPRYRSRLLVIADPVAGVDRVEQFRPLADWLDETLRPDPAPDEVVETVNPFLPPGQQPTVRPPTRPGVHFAALDSNRLADTRAAYEAFDLLVIGGSSLVDVERTKRGALADWVRSGGTLVAFPGPGWLAGGLPSDVADLLHVSMDGGAGRPVPPSRELQIYSTPADREVQEKLVPGPGGEVVENGLAIFAREGAGQVLTFRFMPARTFPRPSEAGPVYEALRKTVDRALSFAGRSGIALRELERVSPAVLFGMSGFEVPPWTDIAWGLGIYLVVGFFIPGFFFKRLGRREWTFLVVVLCSGLATLGIYRYGLLASVEGRELEELSVLRVHADGRAAEATSLLGVIGPSLDRLALDPPRAGEDDPVDGDWALTGGVRPQPLRGQIPTGEWGMGALTSLPLPSLSVEERRKDDFTVGSFTVYPNAMRYFRYDYRLNLQARPTRVRVLPESTESKLEISVRNPFRGEMKLYLVRDGAFQALRKSVPGETEATVTAPLEHSWDQNLGLPGHVSSTLYGNYHYSIEENSEQNSGQELPRDPHQAAALLYTIRSVARPGRRLFRVNTNFGAITTGQTRPQPRSEPSGGKPTLLLGHVSESVFPGLRGVDGIGRNGSTILVFELPLSIYN